MDIEQFVHAALVQIAKGVRKAQDEVRDAGGYVNPATNTPQANDRPTLYVDFDLAVVVGGTTNVDGTASLEIPTFLKVGGGGKYARSSQETTRVSFKVPFVYPEEIESAEQVRITRKEEEARKEEQEQNFRHPLNYPDLKNA